MNGKISLELKVISICISVSGEEEESRIGDILETDDSSA